MTDKFIEEIHAVRQKISEECDYDFQKLGEYYKRLQEKDPERLVTEVRKPEPLPADPE